MSDFVPPLTQPDLLDEGKALAYQARDFYAHLSKDNPVGQFYRDNPYAALALAAGAGYLLAGGLFSPFTRRVLKMSMRAMLIPLAASQLKGIAQSGSHEP